MPDDEDGNGWSSPAFPLRDLAGMVASSAGLLALACLTWVASEAVPTPWSWVLAIVTLGGLLLGAWNLVQLAFAFVMVRLIDRVVSDKPTAWLSRRFQLWLWLLLPAFVVTWATNGVLLGLDQSQWKWTGISTLLACVAVVAFSVKLDSKGPR